MSTCARLLYFPGLLAAVLASPLLRADPGDVAGARDYVGLPRIPGFVITDYTEDNPAAFDFPVAHPTSLDADHVDTVRVTGHRYVLRYESLSDMQPPSLLQTQQYYEKIATREGFALAKSGAVHDVTETFHLVRDGHELWVYLDPAITINTLTIVDGKGQILPPAASVPFPAPPPLPSLIPPGVTAPPDVPPPATEPSEPLPSLVPPGVSTPPDVEATTPDLPPLPSLGPPDATAPPDAPAPTPEPSPPPADATSAAAPDVSDESLYSALEEKGRVVLPVTFLPGKPDLDANSAPVIVSVVAMMQKNPDLQLEIDGFTDSTGDAGHNQRLSAERAATVRDLLVAGHIPENRLVAVGLGGAQPVADNDTPEGREKNRRIELALRTDATPAPAEPDVVEQAPDKPAPTDDSDTDNQPPPVFHPPAPNGVNYYPTQ
jgi:outer membrane protein OmpA-like peptidoglycan-associated protein